MTTRYFIRDNTIQPWRECSYVEYTVQRGIIDQNSLLFEPGAASMEVAPTAHAPPGDKFPTYPLQGVMAKAKAPPFYDSELSIAVAPGTCVVVPAVDVDRPRVAKRYRLAVMRRPLLAVVVAAVVAFGAWAYGLLEALEGE